MLKKFLSANLERDRNSLQLPQDTLQVPGKRKTTRMSVCSGVLPIQVPESRVPRQDRKPLPKAAEAERATRRSAGLDGGAPGRQHSAEPPGDSPGLGIQPRLPPEVGASGGRRITRPRGRGVRETPGEGAQF